MVGITALLILLIINSDLLFPKNKYTLSKHHKAYRLFLYAVATFFTTDILWGIFDNFHLIKILYVDTVIYFVAMSFTIFLWTRYVTIYINIKGFLHKVLFYIGILILGVFIVMLIINCFNPIVFEFNGNDYNANIGRYIMLLAQEGMYFITFVVAMIEMVIERRRLYKNRFIVIGLFSISMAVAILFQVMFPLLPIYSMGIMIGMCLIHTFIVESEKEENRRELKKMLEREIRHEKELDTTKALVYNDALTGAQSKFAYANMEDEIDKLIAANLIKEFSVVVFDINGLKYINDTYGHETGDRHIIECYKIITSFYQNNKVYRFGGDEFVIVLTDEDYDNRIELLEKFEKKIDENLENNLQVVSTGMSDYDPLVDNTYRAVFVRADKKMYERKNELKSRGSHTR